MIATEARDTSLTEQTVVGQILMNRLHRAPEGWTVEQVWRGFAHHKAPNAAERQLARGIIEGSVPDLSQGATHFYSPAIMPKQGDPAKGFDVGGGLEQSIDKDGNVFTNYRPGFTTVFPSVVIPGVDPRNFRIYRQPGNRRVY